VIFPVRQHFLTRFCGLGIEESSPEIIAIFSLSARVTEDLPAN